MHAFLPLGDSVRLGMRETWLLVSAGGPTGWRV